MGSAPGSVGMESHNTDRTLDRAWKQHPSGHELVLLLLASAGSQAGRALPFHHSFSCKQYPKKLDKVWGRPRFSIMVGCNVFLTQGKSRTSLSCKIILLILGEKIDSLEQVCGSAGSPQSGFRASLVPGEVRSVLCFGPCNVLRSVILHKCTPLWTVRL